MTKWTAVEDRRQVASPSASHQPISFIKTTASSRFCAAAAVTSSARTAAALPRWATSVGKRPSIAASRVSPIESPARGVALPTAVAAAVTRRASRDDDHVPDLPGETATAADQLTVGDDAAANCRCPGSPSRSRRFPRPAPHSCSHSAAQLASFSQKTIELASDAPSRAPRSAPDADSRFGA